jgi:hypothetical protein
MFQENFNDFFNLNDFAQPVLLGEVGLEVTISAIFDNAHEAFSENPGVSTVQPKLTCKTSDLPADAQALRVVVGTQPYRIADVRPDGTGITELWLRRVSA